MTLPSLSPVTGLLAGLPAALATLGGTPWWATGAILVVAYLAVPITGMTLDHIRQRKGNALDEKFASALDQIADPEKRIQAIINYRQATTSPQPEPPPGALPPGTTTDTQDTSQTAAPA
ncbi:hypothetical protein AB0B01_11545 [Streptomyces sp. NPDC044571]|uniref:hypothetical protein n=1 Tax=Streptomyces sp. NPDC044571 TaxID=3155371 RepID=UPI0034114B28